MSKKSEITTPLLYIADNIGRLQNESTVLCMTFWRSMRDGHITEPELREVFMSLAKMQYEIADAKERIAEYLVKKQQQN